MIQGQKVGILVGKMNKALRNNGTNRTKAVLNSFIYVYLSVCFDCLHKNLKLSPLKVLQEEEGRQF